jgi:hypothetical protein
MAMLLLSGIIPLSAHADDILLTNGKHLDGSIEGEKDGQVTVRVRNGTLVVAQSQIQSVVRAAGPLDEFNRRNAALGDHPTAKDWQDLALFAEVNGLNREAQHAYQQTLELDPANAQARVALGYKFFNGAWLTQHDYIRAADLVRHNNAWVSREQAERSQQAEARAEGNPLSVSYEGRAAGDSTGNVSAPVTGAANDGDNGQTRRGYTRQSHGYYRQTHNMDPVLPSIVPYGQDTSGHSGSYIIYSPGVLRNYEY